MLKIDGATIAAIPSAMKITITDISSENTKRAIDGTLYIHKLAQKMKIEMSFSWLSEIEMQQLLQQVKTTTTLAGTQTFAVTFRNPATRTDDTRIMYVGDRVVPIQHYINNEYVYKDFTMNLIEI